MNKYIIPCSSSKSTAIYNKKGSLINLSFNEELGSYRKLIIEEYKSNQKNHFRKNERVFAPMLDWSKTEKANNVYEGKVYTNSKSKNWKKCASDNVLIISGLFGLIKASDFIPLYSLDLNDNLGNIKPIKFWEGKLDNILNKYIDIEGSVIINLLSANYQKLITEDCKLGKPEMSYLKYGENIGIYLKEMLIKDGCI